MGKKTKTGKSRKDKFYHLAKETGYRARSAFKLIQLNRKYEFLQKSRVVIDLCAAPGGWLQVVSENTPMSSLIVGVDLVPIRPIHNCITLQEDITTDKCRQALKKELQTWKADTVIHDGAPNVGKNWIHDAFQQAQLTLQALKLATEFLRKGGWFVTKVFRSKDYFALLWVFQQLFDKVHATKPQASRNESAEIFVVCEKFLAPDKIDPKFLDPKHVFQEIEAEPKTKINLIHPEKKKRQREGYPTGDYTLFHTLNVSEFITSDDYLDLLAQTSQVVFDDKSIEELPETTPEIKECLKDIKVLGKTEIKNVLKWRALVRKKKVEQGEEKKDKSAEVEEESPDEEAEIEEKLAQAESEERKQLKKKLKKVRKQKTKLQHKMDLKLVIPGDRHDFSDDVGLFYLKNLKNKQQLDEVEAGDVTFADEFAAENLLKEEDGLSAQQKMVTYNRDKKDHVVDMYSSDEGEEGEEEPEIEDMRDSDELEFEEDDEDESEEEDDDDKKKKSKKNPLIVSLESSSSQTQRKLQSWFNKDSFAGLDDEADEDMEIENMMEEYRKKGGKITDVKDKSQKSKKKPEPDIDSGMEEEAESDSDEQEDSLESESESDSSSDSDSDFDTKEMMKNRPETYKASNNSGFEEVPASDRLDAVGLAIGAAMVQSRKRRRDITESGYHRYMWDEENLPDWFVKDESKHTRRELPVTKGEIEEYKLKERSINARPIKKIAEAKARKKKKEMRRLERARKKAEAISDTTDITERDKWQQMKQVYKKAGLLTKKKKEVTYVVAKKGVGKRVSRPKGVQGPFKVVDSRMKKDFIKQKKQAKVKGKKGRKGKK